MGSVRAGAAKFAIVITVVAVGAKNSIAHVPAWRRSVEIQHLRPEARLWQRAVAIMNNGMARTSSHAELRNDI